MTVRAVSDVRALCANALLQGAVAHSPARVEWDCSGSCESPVFVLWWGRPETRPKRLRAETVEDFVALIRIAERSQGSASLEIWARCRKCRRCLQLRTRHWAYRAKAEIAAAPRTWFGTFTLSPEQHHVIASRARHRLSRGGTDFDCLSQEQQFEERCSEVQRELTLWLKRIRKNSGAKLRYILVAEAHKSGLPHWHMLCHEQWNGGAVKHAELTHQWRLGFSRFKLVEDTNSAWYVCKYLSKSAMARVRASLRYGRVPALSDRVASEAMPPVTPTH